VADVDALHQAGGGLAAVLSRRSPASAWQALCPFPHPESCPIIPWNSEPPRRHRNTGRALDVHTGQGRNAVNLASKGWLVTRFDFSAEGVRAARDAAKKAFVKVTALVRRHEDFDFGRAEWDLVVMSYT
jgi:2-polyprenyl-3-methyl-5-hydroxy-6-metoxy-1,4-benzoquinol methylase